RRSSSRSSNTRRRARSRRSRVSPVVDLTGHRVARPEGIPVRGAPLLAVVGMRSEVEDPLLQPRGERLRIAGDAIPRQVEGVVPVVVALREARMTGERLLDDRVDDHPRDHGPVPILTY